MGSHDVVDKASTCETASCSSSAIARQLPFVAAVLDENDGAVTNDDAFHRYGNRCASLSRGAREAVFVEQEREACAIILQNLEATGLRSAGHIRRADVLRFLARPPRMPFDLVFLDPPYARGLGFVSRVLGKIAAGAWMSSGATVVVEAPEGDVEWPRSMREIKTRRFGRTRVSWAIVGEHEGDLSGHV